MSWLRGSRTERDTPAPFDANAGVAPHESEAGRVSRHGEHPPEHRRRDIGWPNQRTLLLYLIAGLLIAAIPVVVSRFVDQPDSVTHTIDIPLGTAERLAAGEDVEIVPDELDFKLRDVLIIANQDSVTHTIGPFEVGPGERLERSFGEAAAYSSYCSLHPSGSISISIGGG